MINLRYHIVSITAVFLALGIGLAFGAAFINQATVDVLEARLDRIEAQNLDLEDQNAAIENRLDQLAEIESDLLENGLGQLVAGRLDGVPVVVIAVRGIDEDAVTVASEAVQAAGAQFGGVLWLTDRWVLDDQSEIDDLADALGFVGGSGRGLQLTARRQLGGLFARAATPAVEDATETTLPDGEVPEGGVAEGETEEAPDAGVAAVGLPELVQRLVDAGFLDYDQPPAGPPLTALFDEGSGLRVLVLSGEGASVPDDAILLPLIRQVSTTPDAAAPGPVVVAAQRGPTFDAAPPEDADPDAARVVFVGPLRADEELRARLSTVDDLETFAGIVATVLALAHGGDGQFGHYGLGEGAQSLLPAPVEATEAPG